MYHCWLIYTYFLWVSDFNLLLTLTPTLTITIILALTLTLKNEKGKYSHWSLCFNFILKWKMTCDEYAVVWVKNVTLLSWTIFSCRGDRLAQNFLVCIIVGLCRSIYFRVEPSGMQQYILWPGLFVQNCMAYVTGWPELDTLKDRLAQKCLLVWNCTSL